MKQTIVIACMAAALAAPAAGQENVAAARADVERLQAELARVPVESRITKGAPYSGEAVTETLQVLSDGNRISRKTTTRIYRDSEGRIRRENVSATGEVTTINISDPVAESMYVLYPQTKVAQRNGVIMATPRGAVAGSVAAGSAGVVVATRSPDGAVRVVAGGDATAEAGRKAEVEARAAPGPRGGGGGGMVGATGPMLERVPAPGTDVKKEELGQQMIEGVLATGTRVTTTIPAGSIGNAKPILIVSEQWFSDDLKVLVVTKHNDPRNGETTYRLTNIVQGEPQHALFEVPADYTVKESVIRRDSPQTPRD